MHVEGVCFGFQPSTTVPLQFLRVGRGQPLEIAEASNDPPSVGRPLREWRPPANPLYARLYRDDERFHLWVEDGGWYSIDPGRPQILVPRGVDPLRREERLWSIPALLCFVARGDVPLHGAAVEIEGEAVLLCGASRAGKTTLAAALSAAGHRVLAEDLSCVRLLPSPAVLPGPAMLRVRDDVYGRLEPPGTVVGRDEHRIHLALDGELRGDGGAVPLRAILLLQRSGHLRSERVPPQNALRDLWGLSLKLPLEEDRARCFHGLVQVTEAVPIWSLQRPLTYGDLPAVMEEVARLCSLP